MKRLQRLMLKNAKTKNSYLYTKYVLGALVMEHKWEEGRI